MAASVTRCFFAPVALRRAWILPTRVASVSVLRSATLRTDHARSYSDGAASKNDVGPAEAVAINRKMQVPQDRGIRFPEFELNDKVFIVTGGARGLGLTMAGALVEAGAHGESGSSKRKASL